jgi:hypothetical protein
MGAGHTSEGEATAWSASGDDSGEMQVPGVINSRSSRTHVTDSQFAQCSRQRAAVARSA